MENLNERQKFILGLVIHEYIRTAAPVGSKKLVEQYHLDISSATVRNELSELTEKGFLQQPYTSAGRVPTEKGYRHFVTTLMQMQELNEETRRMIEHQFSQSQDGIDGWIKLAASVLASQSKAVSLVSAPVPERTNLKRLALVPITGKNVLMVLVLTGGQMQQRSLFLDSQVTEGDLLAIQNKVNSFYIGKTSEQIHQDYQSFSGKNSLSDVIIRNILSAMYETDALKAGEVYLDGINNVLVEPEFVGSEEARRSLDILDEKPVLQNFLSKANQDQKIGGIQVVFGGDGLLKQLKNCSVILARYGIPGMASGSIGVLGPMRMAYSRNIPVVRFISDLLSEIMSESYTD